MKEEVREQKRIMAFVYIAWLIASVLPGLDHRFGWSHLPLWVKVFSQAVVFGGYAMTFWVVKVNRFCIANDSGRTQSESDFQRVVPPRSPSHVFGRVCDLVVHALGSRIILDLACLRSRHPADRSSSPERGKGSASRTTGLCGILRPHPLSARPFSLVGDILSKARR